MGPGSLRICGGECVWSFSTNTVTDMSVLYLQA